MICLHCRKLRGRMKQTLPLKANILSIFKISFRHKKEKLLLRDLTLGIRSHQLRACLERLTANSIACS